GQQFQGGLRRSAHRGARRRGRGRASATGKDEGGAQSGAARPRRARRASPFARARRAFGGDFTRARLRAGRDRRAGDSGRDAPCGGRPLGRGGVAAETAMPLARSFLYVPANREKFLDKARDLSADALLLDLEDSVPPAEKAVARAAVREFAPKIPGG